MLFPVNLQKPLILAIDVGSSSLRSLVYEPSGKALPDLEARRSYEFQITPDGGVEARAEELFALLVECLDEIQQKIGEGWREIAGVALCTFWHNLLGMDREGRVRTPILTWADTRSQSAASQLKHQLDPVATHQRTGCHFHPSYLPAKLLWLSEHQPETFREVSWWGSVGEFILLRLFGKPLCSISMASGTGLMDQQLCRWDPELLTFLKVDESKLSPLGDLNTPLHGLQEPFSSRWPFLRSIPWFPAIGDGASSNIGSGCSTPDRVAVMVGTSGAMRVVLPARSKTIPAGLWCYHVDRQRLVMGGALSNGGNLFQWMGETLLLPRDQDAIQQDLARRLPGAHGLTVLPFLAGERSTGWNPAARAAITGLSLHTSGLDILQASLEAVSYRFARILNLLVPKLPPHFDIVATGGALLQSPAWVQILADVFGIPIFLAEAPEASSRGAALLAAEAMGLIPELETLPPLPAQRFLPNLQNHEWHRELMIKQERLYSLLSDPGEKPG
jgi:gluconokinase